MEKRKYNKLYLSWLWLAVLTITPLMLLFIDDLMGKGEIGTNFIALYFLMVIFGLVFSMPVGILSVFLYLGLIKANVKPVIIKIVVISIVVLGIFITFHLIGGAIRLVYGSYYSFTAIVAGLLMRVTPSVKID